MNAGLVNILNISDGLLSDEDRILLLADESDKARIRKFIYQVSTHIDHSLLSAR